MKYAQRFARKRWREDQFLPLLKDAVNAAGGASEFARQAGCNRQFVSSVLAGKQPVSDRLLAALGLRRVISAERVDA